MIVDRYDPVNLFEMVPKLKLHFEPELARLDELLDDDELFCVVKADLIRRYPNSARLGRHSTPVEVILRMLVVKRLHGWSYEQTERFVNDSIVLRQFCRLYLQSAPDDTTLIRWANQIGSETVVALNDRAVELARSLKVTRGRKLRVDAMVVQTNVHHPTDSALLRDGVRVLSRLLRRAKDALPTQIAGRVLGREAFRTRNRSVRRVAQRLHRTKPGAKEKKPKRISKKPTESCWRSPGQVALRPRKSPKRCGNTPQAEPKIWWSAWSISYLWWSEGSTRPLAVSSKASRCRPPRSF